MKSQQEREVRRQARLAQNLRANLLRRKAQARQRQVKTLQIPPEQEGGAEVEIQQADHVETAPSAIVTTVD